MEKDYQTNNSISDTANNNDESNKPEHEIKVEIVSIEVVSEYSVLVLIITSAIRISLNWRIYICLLRPKLLLLRVGPFDFVKLR